MWNSKVLLLALVGVNLTGLGLFLLRSANLRSSPVTFDTYQSSSNPIKVDVSGSVKSPGIYELSDTSRIEDAIASAGGFQGDADQIWVSQYLNKSQTLSDGQKIYVPAISATNIAGKKISVNKDSKEALISLKGIGEVTAGKIIAGRPFADLNELWERKIVTKKIFEGIQDQLILW